MLGLLKSKKVLIFEVVIAALLPFLFYMTVFWGKSFGFDCAPGVMGNYPPYQQKLTVPNEYCASIIDPGAYVWQHPAQWIEGARQLVSGHLPIWSQNEGIGVPLSSNFISTAFYLPLLPFSILFYFTKNLLFIDLFFVFRYMVASVGMFLFIRSLKVNRELSWLAAFVFFSSGYFIVIPNISHHSVDILLPWVAWGLTRLFYSGEKKWIGISSLLLGLSMLGGMPESSIFILFFVSIYITFLSFCYADGSKFRFWFYGLLVLGLGIAIGAILYFPGLEFITNGVSNHDGSGNQKFVDWHNIIFFILPEIFAGTYGYQYVDKLNFAVSSWNYIGTTIVYLYTLCLTYILELIRRVRTDKKVRILTFFWLLGLVLILQQYGIVHFYLFENFPFFRQTQFSKYSSTLINFSIITSSIIFLEYIFKKSSKRALLVGLIFIAGLLYINIFYKDAISVNQYLKKYFGFMSPNILYALGIVSVLSFVLAFIKNNKFRIITLFVLVIFEFYIYFPRRGDQVRRDSFRQPPAISFLLKKNYKEFRIFGLDNILFPNLAMAYDLNDVRMLDALWIDRYFQYMKNFFAEPDAFRITGIKENNATQSANIVDNPYFDMLSAKYILTYNKIETEVFDNSLIDEAVTQNHKAVNVAKTIFDINKDSKQVLFEHAPNDISVVINKPIGANYLMIYPALSPNLFGKKEGNGVLFRAELYAGQNKIFSKEVSVDSSNKSEDEKWFEFKVGPFVGSQSGKYKLRLITDPMGNNSYDWSGWGGFVWDTELSKTVDKYKLVYDDEMKIYENQKYVPRIHFVDQKICVPNYDPQDKYRNVIDLMRFHKSDIVKTAIVDGVSCEMTKYNSKEVVISDQIFDDNKITFTYSSGDKQYGVLSDAYYPGWNIYINGKKGKIDPANLAFKGFELPPGKSVVVELRYQPVIFRVGVIVSLMSVAVSVFIIVIDAKKRKRTKSKK